MRYQPFHCPTPLNAPSSFSCPSEHLQLDHPLSGFVSSLGLRFVKSTLLPWLSALQLFNLVLPSKKCKKRWSESEFCRPILGEKLMGRRCRIEIRFPNFGRLGAVIMGFETGFWASRIGRIRGWGLGDGLSSALAVSSGLDSQAREARGPFWKL